MWNPDQNFEMTPVDVLWFLRVMDERGVDIWLDGGWAVDAALGRQTRRHEDLDIVLEQRHLDAAMTALLELGFEDVPRDDTRPWNFVLGDDRGHLVDFHVVVLAEDGRGIYGPPDTPNPFYFPAESFTWTGSITGHAVRGLPPKVLVEFHTGYEPDADDWADVSALCDKFGLLLPDEYQRFATGHASTCPPVPRCLDLSRRA